VPSTSTARGDVQEVADKKHAEQVERRRFASPVPGAIQLLLARFLSFSSVIMSRRRGADGAHSSVTSRERSIQDLWSRIASYARSIAVPSVCSCNVPTAPEQPRDCFGGFEDSRIDAVRPT